ncbi:MAG: RNA-guided endonuclease TnpB family protein [Defluviitaleaceae bacterium]|nr:RNA-guided endonuclease TnpB family protein [Defluviitaleaceae bacterium]
MIKSVKIRLKPTKNQQKKLWRSAGVARFAYNWALEKQKQNYQNSGKFIKNGDLRKEFTVFKKQDKNLWLYETSNNVAKQAIKDVDVAFKNFFNKKSRFPKFKSKKKSKPSFYNDNVKLRFKKDSFLLEKIGWIKCSEPWRIYSDEFYNPRVSYDGKYWYISVGQNYEPVQEELTKESLGISFLPSKLAYVSNGMNFDSIDNFAKVKKLNKKITRLKKSIVRKEKNINIKSFKNINKQTKKLNIVTRKLINFKKDLIYKVISMVVKTKPSRIVIQSLNIKHIKRNSMLHKSIKSQNVYNFKRILEYKCKLANIEFVESVDDPKIHTNTCYVCGNYQNSENIKIFKCEECGNRIDKISQSAINLSISNW